MSDKTLLEVVTYSDDETILDVKTIKTINGIDVDEIELQTEGEDHNYTESLVLLAVAQFQPSHGYERVIRSLYNYYQEGGQRNIIVNMIGYGSELMKYKRLVSRYNVDKHIRFFDKKQGTELEKFYSNADIGLGVFGLYKRRVKKSSALKIREYLANGLPIVSGCTEDVFENDRGCDFFCGFRDDSSDIEFDNIISFYDKLKEKYDKNELRESIRIFASENIDFSITMKPILEYIRED